MPNKYPKSQSTTGYWRIYQIVTPLKLNPHSANLTDSVAKKPIQKHIKLYQAELVSLKSQDASANNWALTNSKTQQKNWLRYQRNQCHSIHCIEREYQERINEMSDTDQKKVTRSFFTDVSQPVGKPGSFAYGEFTDQHKISIYNPTQTNDQLIETTDAVTIFPIPNKPELAIIDVDITGGNAHTCTLSDKKFIWRENHWALFKNKSYGKKSGLDDVKCELRVYPSKKFAVIKDVDNQCKRLYCGVRAGFYGNVFKRVKKD